ncbi:MAG TPA: lytic transglycosylase domain-containing protein [Acidimicrobiales bacterium]|nr:lytic transglycosylase domain-containing protein [Acidimicrobiales bacterium]
MGRRLAVALVALAVLGACSGDEKPMVASGDTSTTSTTVASEAPTTTAVAAPSTSGTASATTRPATTLPGGGAALAAGDPASVAVALAASEAAIRDPGTPMADLERHGRAQQVAYRQLAAHPEWLDQVLDGVPQSLHATVRANVAAGTELRALTKPQPALPPWRIVAPAPADELLGYYKSAADALGVPWNYLAAIHLVETRMGRIRGTSTSGAQGPMQFLPATWAQYGEGGDINSNRDSILAAARYLARNGAPADLPHALYAYNHSQHYVNAVTAYAEQMGTAERAYYGYYQWQVYYRMADGDHLLPVGYGS